MLATPTCLGSKQKYRGRILPVYQGTGAEQNLAAASLRQEHPIRYALQRRQRPADLLLFAARVLQAQPVVSGRRGCAIRQGDQHKRAVAAGHQRSRLVIGQPAGTSL